MREHPQLWIEKARLPHPVMGESPFGGTFGFFEVWPLRIISSGYREGRTGPQAWEHVSVSCRDRCPTWDEMKRVKEAFWADEETVLQYHPKRANYQNLHPFCLHLWKPPAEVELPPMETV